MHYGSYFNADETGWGVIERYRDSAPILLAHQNPGYLMGRIMAIRPPARYSWNPLPNPPKGMSATKRRFPGRRRRSDPKWSARLVDHCCTHYFFTMLNT